MELIITLLYLLLSCNYAEMLWPNERKSIIEGDLFLAGFFPIHESDYDNICGRITEEGLQQLEIFLHAVKTVNEDRSILPGVKLGALGLDCCDSPSHVLEVAMQFMDEFTASNEKFRQQLQCNNGTNIRYHRNYNRLVGVVGGKSSGVSIQLANLLRVFQVPQVSYKSAAPVLSNKYLYEYFFRTVPPIVHQVEALLEIVKYFHWEYISVVYSDTDYGNAGFESLRLFVERSEICLATVQRVNVEIFEDSDYIDVLEALLSEKATAVMIIGEQRLAKNIMKAAKHKGARNRFVWLGVEAWVSRDYAVKDYEEYAEGALCVTYVMKTPPGLLEHFRSLTPENAEESNPWFYELWEKKKECRLPKYPETPYNRNFSTNCSGSIPDEKYMKLMPSARLVKNAVYAFATALNAIHREKCDRKPGWCDAMNSLNGNLLRQHLLKVKFHDYNGNIFQFDSYGDVLPHYYISNYQKHKTNNSYYWRRVGTFIKDRGYLEENLLLDEDIMAFKHFRKTFPESVCSKPCLPDEKRVFSDSQKCCWTCFNCTENYYIGSKGTCEECDKGYKSSEDKKFCKPIPEVHMDYRNRWAIICITFAVLGIMITSAVTVIFWKNWDTPIIKASARELSALLLLGIFLSFLFTFVIVSKPTRTTCGIVRFFLGFNYTICYAAIVTKTRIIALIFERRGRKLKPKYSSPQSQLIIAFGITSIEVIINATWLIYDTPSTTNIHPTTSENILICRGFNRNTYLLGLLYPFLLMIICTIYAFKTRKCPDGFNEARYITFTNYITCVIWLALIPTFTFHKCSQVRTFTLSLLLSSSAAVQLVCLFLPKAFIAMLQPENNTKDTVMAHSGGTSSSSL